MTIESGIPRYCLQSFGDDHRIAGCLPFCIDHHQTSGDADANREMAHVDEFFLREGFDYSQTGANGAVGLVLMRKRLFEVSENTVAFPLDDLAFETLRGAQRDLPEARDNRSHVLWDPAAGQRRHPNMSQKVTVSWRRSTPPPAVATALRRDVVA